MIKKRYFKTKDECEITFEYKNGAVSEVALVGDFNDWQPMVMKKANKKDAPYRIKIRLPIDRDYQFRYYVDQEVWVNDEAADAYWPNQFGEENSVVNTANSNGN